MILPGQLELMDNAIQRGFKTLSLSVTAAILMSGWTPDDPNVASDERAARAIRAARNIVFDADLTAQGMRP